MTRVGEVRRLAEGTPPERDRYVDLVRAFAIGAVVVGHWLAVYVTHEGGRFQGRSVLEVVPWTHPLTWAFQVMPLFFLVGGYANAASFTSHLRRGGDATGWVLDRAARLVRPTAVLLAGLAVAALVAGWLGVAPELIGVAVWLASIPLWFLVAYIAVVVLTPPMFELHRRAGLAVPIGLAVLVGLGDLARLVLGVPYVGQANFLLAWLGVHQLGFAWRDGRLPSRPGVALPLAGAGLAALLLLTVAGPYPVSMVAFAGEEVQNTSPPTLALLALAVTQTGIALLLGDRAGRWLRRPGPWTAVVGVNSVIMTVFLWHMTAVVFGVLALYGTGLMPQPAPGSAAWLLLRIPWLACLALILAVPVLVFGRIEQRSVRRNVSASPTSQPPDVHGPDQTMARHTSGPKFGVHPVLTVVGAAAVLGALLSIALAGSSYHGPTGLPAGSLVVFFAGMALLSFIRRRHPG
ncbi:acyltransferase [Sphaerisporangium sp. TRM90804]|uniref:acyltransferase family protein n=1 Tax=Sphaerisporangium sp. TRM90804 TaxID=3031113 RepID=UPI00244BBDE9|nr:acyltransferase [Sphaerisporangium sp. TRM90804]MDH2430711.1 acyltransferase [Sphaerisporangium sp. TRM90804]